MRFQAVSQIVLIGLSVALLFFVIKPKYESVAEIQAEIAAYKEAVATAGQVQSVLANLQAKIAAIDPSDQRALDAYLPEKIDTLSVSRDITTIMSDEGMIVGSVSAGEVRTPVVEEVPRLDAGPAPVEDTETMDPLLEDGMMDDASSRQEEVPPLTTQRFSVSVFGDYEEMKSALAALERNHYPLHVVAIEFGSSQGGGETSESTGSQSFTLQLETYALPAQTNDT